MRLTVRAELLNRLRMVRNRLAAQLQQARLTQHDLGREHQRRKRPVLGRSHAQQRRASSRQRGRRLSHRRARARRHDRERGRDRSPHQDNEGRAHLSRGRQILAHSRRGRPCWCRSPQGTAAG
eukprot:719494-Prymnesium_polylepis.1